MSNRVYTSGKPKGPPNFHGPRGVAFSLPRQPGDERWTLWQGDPFRIVQSWDIKGAEINNWNPYGDFMGICFSSEAAVRFVAGDSDD